MTLPKPPTPPDLDLRDFDWMPLDVKRLRDSDLAVLAPGDAFRAAVLLWCAAWHQVPAGSLPKDERLLANFAGYGRDLRGWQVVRTDALRGFAECSDGRLYHPVVAEKAIEADGQRNAKRKRTEKATDARRNGKRNDQRDDRRNDTDDDARNEHHQTETKTETLPDQTESGEGVTLPRADLKLVEEGQPIPINESYQPSDRAIEYAYSLGMKKADLNSELSKFIALSMASRAKSYNPDMSFKAFCDRWLDFKRNKDPNWKPAPEPVVEPQEDRSAWPIVVEGTPEHTCWNIICREQGRMPLFLCKQLAADGKIYERAARCPTLFPVEFNDFGERLAPANEEDAA